MLSVAGESLVKGFATALAKARCKELSGKEKQAIYALQMMPRMV
jgi:hypothetical protein